MRKSIPFHIFAAYCRLVTSPKPEDAVLAEMRRIVIPGEMPEKDKLPSWD
jgi:hypothetical protein